MNTPVHPQIQRTLAAIVVTDAVGFSKRMSQDEDQALAMINRDIKLISELCEFFEGKILKTVGDGVLMYFVSAVQAATCAVEMQKTFIGFAKGEQAGDHFTHRVGVHLGDIFFNQTDMMGTGVNVAARLESAAKAGAICMSQVVYDVVKARLEIDADYIGELELKNISSAVAAYNVWPKGMRPDNTGDDVTAAVAPLTITPINVALKKLSAHPNHRRIKKLLYGTHQSSWENNTAILEGIPLKVLLESLTDRNGSLEECQRSLYAIVGTLNRQETYSKVAEVILESLQGVYVEITGGTFRNTEEPSLLESPLTALYKDIALQLEQTADPIRTKKLLYCLCYDSWENDNQRVEAMDATALVEILHGHIPSIHDLQERLKIVLLRLNRRAKYSPIANTIFKECQALYPEMDSQISMPGAAGIEESHTENTQINIRKRPPATGPKVTAKQTKDHSANHQQRTPLMMRSPAFGS
ncbi:MAG: adenylate/guanylate cyclase domain-containing protein [Cyanobacteria bacterium J06560_2]